MITEIDNTPLATRMKRYEFAYRQYLPRRSYTLMRLDGRAFHTYLKDAEKPFDPDFIKCMDVVAEALCRDIQGAKFAYTQSDEISILITDFDTLQSEPWFDGRIDKMTSVAASNAAATLYALRPHTTYVPQFDCRVWTINDPVEVANYFVWRQMDWTRNSIQMMGQHYFSVTELKGKSCDEIQEMLFSEHGINWNNIGDGLKRGRVIWYRGLWPKDPTRLAQPDDKAARARWQAADAPRFEAAPGNWLAGVIPPLPSLWNTEETA